MSVLHAQNLWEEKNNKKVRNFNSLYFKRRLLSFVIRCISVKKISMCGEKIMIEGRLQPRSHNIPYWIPLVDTCVTLPFKSKCSLLHFSHQLRKNTVFLSLSRLSLSMSSSSPVCLMSLAQCATLYSRSHEYIISLFSILLSIWYFNV